MIEAAVVAATVAVVADADIMITMEIAIAAAVVAATCLMTMMEIAIAAVVAHTDPPTITIIAAAVVHEDQQVISVEHLNDAYGVVVQFNGSDINLSTYQTAPSNPDTAQRPTIDDSSPSFSGGESLILSPTTASSFKLQSPRSKL